MNTATTTTKNDEQKRKLSLHYAGIHRQEDRDARFAVKAAGSEKQFWHMVRVRVPLGTLSAAQYIALDKLADRVTYNRSLRVTAGQSVQLHGVAERDLEAARAELAEIGLAAGCDPEGLEFAIAVPPAPIENSSYLVLRGLAAELCDELYPQPGKGWSEAFANHSPRKFTVGLGLPEDNSVNVFANDVGLLMVTNEAGERRVNVYAGGSLSMPSRRPDTYARLASPLGSVETGKAVAVVRAIAAVFKRFGKLETKKHTRLKYVVDELGVEAFRREVELELGMKFSELIECGELRSPSWCGLRDQQNGAFYYGLGVPYGRIQHNGLARYKAAIRLIVEAFRPRVILSPDQNIIFAGLRIEQIEALENILAAYHVPHGDGLSPLRFEAMSCAGLPTCPLAVAESERVAPQLVEELERVLKRIGKEGAPFSFRVSGCSIGCIRPNMVDLGAIGRKPGHYDLYVGGSEATGRFGELYQEMVPLAGIVASVTPLLEAWSELGSPGESFSDFYARSFGHGVREQRLAPCEAVAARERVEGRIAGLRALAA